MPTIPLQSIAKRVLLLRLRGGGYLICDEYNPHDGRVHILEQSAYGVFDISTFTLEVRKASFDVASIAYTGHDWPTPIAGSKNPEEILTHFSRPRNV